MSNRQLVFLPLHGIDVGSGSQVFAEAGPGDAGTLQVVEVRAEAYI